VKQVFEPIINDILRFISEQVTKALVERQGKGIKVRLTRTSQETFSNFSREYSLLAALVLVSISRIAYKKVILISRLYSLMMLGPRSLRAPY
jgi:hypothetical protein